jgi:DNA-binding NarL/FixJ family response regulator
LAVYRAAPSSPVAQPGALRLLTDREREVLGLIGQGCTNAEIAERLFVSEGTIKTHVNHLFAKLDLRDRAAAIIFAYDNGMIDHDL